MDGLKLSDNIIRLRREHKITQEELADFLGVTKASVSKWENAQSTPDILLLLQMAAFFDMTIDELIGYEPQLSRQQIRRFYAELARDFEKSPFQEAIEKTLMLARRYYSCYPFLLQLSVLCCNHYMLAESEEEQKQILEEAVSWGGHISWLYTWSFYRRRACHWGASLRCRRETEGSMRKPDVIFR